MQRQEGRGKLQVRRRRDTVTWDVTHKGDKNVLYTAIGAVSAQNEFYEGR